MIWCGLFFWYFQKAKVLLRHNHYCIIKSIFFPDFFSELNAEKKFFRDFGAKTHIFDSIKREPRQKQVGFAAAPSAPFGKTCGTDCRAFEKGGIVRCLQRLKTKLIIF